ncbi:hypothetical protein [Taklimakanibacter deserti]|uniref:hypothetical protein n=1 Tax=Taklimakanibacter deserti TaxID=2267839 RepID=UPI000E65AC84
MTEELIGRLESGDGEDRKLDAALLYIADREQYERCQALYVEKAAEAAKNGLTNRDLACWNYGFSACPHYTLRLDAAISLVEKMLPGAEFNLTNLYGVAQAELPLNHSERGWETGRHKGGSLPRAVLIAMLAALSRQEE